MELFRGVLNDWLFVGGLFIVLVCSLIRAFGLVVWIWDYMVCLWLGCVWLPAIGLAIYLVCCWVLIAGFGF